MTTKVLMTDISDTMSDKKLLLISLVLIVIWGGAFTFVGAIVKHIHPAWLVGYRLLIGSLALTIFMHVKGYSFPPIKDKRWIWYLSLGCTGMCAPFFLVATAQTHIDSGLTAILMGAMPLMTILLAHVFTEEKLNARKLIGFTIGFLGVIVLFFPENLSLGLVENWKYQLLILVAACFYGLTTVGAKRAPKTRAAVGAVMMLYGATFFTFLGIFIYGIEGAIPASGTPSYEIYRVLACIIALGLGSTAFATILYLNVIDQTGPSTMAKINYFVPVASVFFGVQFLGENLNWRMPIAFVIIMIGVIIARDRKIRTRLPFGRG